MRRRFIDLSVSPRSEVAPDLIRPRAADRRGPSTRSRCFQPGVQLVDTAGGARYRNDDYLDSGCGLGKATLYLAGCGVRVCGTGGWEWDPPMRVMEGHKAGREIGYCPLKKRANLDPLPPRGLTVACFPTRIHRASAGWTRAVAIPEASILDCDAEG